MTIGSETIPEYSFGGVHAETPSQAIGPDHSGIQRLFSDFFQFRIPHSHYFHAQDNQASTKPHPLISILSYCLTSCHFRVLILGRQHAGGSCSRRGQSWTWRSTRSWCSDQEQRTSSSESLLFLFLSRSSKSLLLFHVSKILLVMETPAVNVVQVNEKEDPWLSLLTCHFYKSFCKNFCKHFCKRDNWWLDQPQMSLKCVLWHLESFHRQEDFVVATFVVLQNKTLKSTGLPPTRRFCCCCPCCFAK